MATLTNKALADLERKLTVLLQEIRQQPEFARVKLYVSKMTSGKLLSEYLHDENVPCKERATLAESLVEILLTRDYDRLPAVEPASKKEAVIATLEEEAESLSTEPEEDEVNNPLTRAQIEQMIDSRVKLKLSEVFATIAKVLGE